MTRIQAGLRGRAARSSRVIVAMGEEVRAAAEAVKNPLACPIELPRHGALIAVGARRFHEIVAGQRRRLPVLRQLDLEDHPVLEREELLRSDQVELPHAVEARIVALLDPGTVGGEALMPAA